MQCEALARHEDVAAVQAMTHEQRSHVRDGVGHGHTRAMPNVLIMPGHSRDGVSAVKYAVLALVAARAMQQHYAGAVACAIVELPLQ